MDKRYGGAGVCVDDVDHALHLPGESLDDPGAETWLGFIRPDWHANAVVHDRQSPVWAIGAIIYLDLAMSTFWEGVLEGIDYEFGNDQREAHGHIRGDDAVIDGYRNRQLLGIVDHRCAETFAELGKIRRKRHVPGTGRR